MGRVIQEAEGKGKARGSSPGPGPQGRAGEQAEPEPERVGGEPWGLGHKGHGQSGRGTASGKKYPFPISLRLA